MQGIFKRECQGDEKITAAVFFRLNSFSSRGGMGMQIVLMIWNGISGLGNGTVILKGLFILVLGAIVWMLCELVKYMMNVFARLAVDALRYLAIVARGWPQKEENTADSPSVPTWKRKEKEIR